MIILAFLAVFCLAVSEAAPKDNQCAVSIEENEMKSFITKNIDIICSIKSIHQIT
jgi:hypothetical protein